MSLSPGSRFGAYEVADPVGAGGMGEVYRAHDTSLKRDVALKVLPQAVVDDADRLARLQREAEILASLNHPNIAQVYGLEKADGQTAIVMELVEGWTLADRIKDGPVPPDEAMAIASQVLAALEAAHDRHIVHRDLKPANVKVKEDGTVKVLDFGISKSIDPAAISGGTPLATTPAVTQTGVILGTAAYMSPEQARGKFVDERTDIWAFGCLLFEMLTGQPAFGGEDVMLTLARVLDRDTDLSSIPKTISPAVRHTIRLCLQKDPRQRISDIRDVRLALEGRFETEMRLTDATARTPLWRRALPVVASLIIGGLLVGFAAFSRWPAPEFPVVARFKHQLEPGQTFRGTGGNVLTLSADGSHLAYNASDGIYVRALGELAPRLVLPSTGNYGYNNLAFAPDGEWIAYYDRDDQQLKKISVSGGSPVRLTATSSNPTGVSWTDQGSILFSQPMGIFRVPATGGEPELVIESQGPTYFDPQRLSDGSILYMEIDSGGPSIILEKPGADDRTVLFAGDRAIYLPTGHLITTDSASPGTLFIRSFDLVTRAFGGPVPVQEGIAVDANGRAVFEVSPSGTFAFGNGVTTANVPEVRLAMIDRMGRVEPLDLPPDQYRGPRVSPDGTKLAVEIIGENDRSSIWIYDLTGQQAFHPLLGAGSNVRPLWADGARLFFGSNRDGNWGIYWQDADGSGVAERLTQAEPGVQHWPDSWSSETRTLAFTRLEGDLSNIQEQSVWTVAIDEDGRAGEPEMLDAGQGGGAAWSPNGRWIAYRSNDATFGAANEIHVQPYPTTGEHHVLTEAGGTYPVWSADGEELIFRHLAAYRGVAPAIGPVNLVLGLLRVESGASLVWGNETEISVPNGIAFYGYRGFDPMPDGEHLVGTITSASSSDNARATSLSVEIVTNWFELVKERVPTE